MHFIKKCDIISKLSKIWPVGQAAKTLASHAGNMGSIPVRVTKKKNHTIGVVFLFADSAREIEVPERKLGRVQRFAFLHRKMAALDAEQNLRLRAK